MSDSKPLLLVATGSSGSIILPAYLSEIGARIDRELVVLLTHTAQRFVTPEVVGWFCSRVITPESPGVNPIELALNAAAIAVLPASGNTLASAALGLMSTQATTVLAASPEPCLFFPHLHEVVWSKPVMQGHVAALRTAGHTVHDPMPADGYEISRGKQRVGLSMPGPGEAAAIIAEWLTAADWLAPDSAEARPRPTVVTRATG